MPAANLPPWSAELISLYESHAANQFILHGNVQDLMPIPAATGTDGRLGSMDDFLMEIMLPGFDVVLTYDLGNGLRVTKGQKQFATWPSAPAGSAMPRAPRDAVEIGRARVGKECA